jgi:AcrR family transcriptional regulator
MPLPARREQLLDVTAEIVDGQGFQAVSIQSVARAAGVSRPIIYEHFGDLKGLLEALVERETNRALAEVAQTSLPALDQGDPVELMLGSLRAYLRAVQQNPRTWRLVLLSPEGAPEILRESIARGRHEVLDELTRAVRPGMRRGDTDPDPVLTAHVLSAIADEYARLALADPSEFPAARLLLHAHWLLNRLNG